MVVPAQRGVNRRPVSLLGSANLVRPRLCLDGPSNIASRHRPEATTVTRACTPRKSPGRPSASFGGGKNARRCSSLEIDCEAIRWGGRSDGVNAASWRVTRLSCSGAAEL